MVYIIALLFYGTCYQQVNSTYYDCWITLQTALKITASNLYSKITWTLLWVYTTYYSYSPCGYFVFWHWYQGNSTVLSLYNKLMFYVVREIWISETIRNIHTYITLHILSVKLEPTCICVNHWKSSRLNSESVNMYPIAPSSINRIQLIRD